MRVKRDVLTDALNDRVAKNRWRAEVPMELDLSPNPEMPGPGSAPLIAVAELRFRPEQQPREMLPAEVWGRLISEGTNDPAGALVALKESAMAEPGSHRVLGHVQELSRSVRTSGVLVPLSVVWEQDAYVVLDGHCRAMAAVLAGRDTVPVNIIVREDRGAETQLTDASHRFVLNMTQEKLAPLECAQLLKDITALAVRVVLSRDGDSAVANDEAEVAAALDGEATEDEGTHPPSGEGPDQKLRRGQTRTHALAAEARALVLEATGLTRSHYHQLYRLYRLHPDAKKLGEGLSEGHLAAIVGAPTELQPLLVKLVQAASASVKETRAYCRAAREQGEDFLVRRYAEVLRSREGAARRRTAVSWEPLIRAVPEDLTPRISALRAELAALDEARRAVRLRAIANQRRLIEELGRIYDEILTQYGEMNRGTEDGETAEG